MAYKDYYSILGLTSSASQEEIKTAYRKLSIKFHPDKNDGDKFLEEMFKNINEANEILSNPAKRKEYDETANHFNTSFKPTSNANDEHYDNVKAVYDDLFHYLDKEKIADNKFILLRGAEYAPVPKHFTVTKFLFSVVVFLILFAIKPSTSEGAGDNVSGYEWVTSQDAVIYKKPDFNSEEIGNAQPNTGFNALKETKYFIKVEFDDGTGSIRKGYILKDKLTHQ